jgi:hypothetical protein
MSAKLNLGTFMHYGWISTSSFVHRGRKNARELLTNRYDEALSVLHLSILVHLNPL